VPFKAKCPFRPTGTAGPKAPQDSGFAIEGKGIQLRRNRPRAQTPNAATQRLSPLLSAPGECHYNAAPQDPLLHFQGALIRRTPLPCSALGVNVIGHSRGVPAAGTVNLRIATPPTALAHGLKRHRFQPGVARPTQGPHARGPVAHQALGANGPLGWILARHYGVATVLLRYYSHGERSPWEQVCGLSTGRLRRSSFPG
jgi:hypothetical protein